MRPALIALCVAATLLTGCDQKSDMVAAAADASPGYDPRASATFDPVAFFNGHTRSWGVVESRSGAPTEWIVTDSHGSINEANQLRMIQHLTFQDGTTQQRDWTLWRSGPGRFDATASDMVGTAKGEASGGMFHWQWVLARAPGTGLMDVTMSQWMYHLEDGSVMIRTTVSKLGFIAAEVSERFSRGEKAER